MAPSSAAPEQSRIVIVLGMHRSGTSAVTEALTSLGVVLGDRLHPPREDNAHGFFEDRDCFAINEQLLQYLGSAWDRLAPGWKFAGSDGAVAALKVQAARLILAKRSEHGPAWGFKDPRTARLLGFWREVIQSCGLVPSFVIVVRNPLSVALSLEKRDQMPAEKSYLLWLQHVLPAVLDTAGCPRVLLDYDLLVNKPVEQISRLAKGLGFHLPQASAAACVHDTLDNQLRHSELALTNLRLDSRVPEDVATAYDMLSRIARDEIAIDDRGICEQLAAINARLNSYFSVFQHLDKLADEKIALNNALSERDAQLTALNDAVSQSRTQLAEFGSAAAEKAGEVDALSQILTEKAVKIESLNQTIAEQLNQLKQLNQTVGYQAEQIASLKGVIARNEKSKVAVDKSLAEGEARIAALNRTVAALEARIHSFGRTTSDHLQEISALKAANAALKNSLSWRITAPLRSVFGILFRR